ncbi:RHS repeat-associated core domain-containing protein [Sorangium sp. So ce233]|uniref:RHS repeat-associated core domain-containing protein n=1 Tax=Sorangium sp. So ce233 TaxID=3133290 RepID=UPI003F62FDE5
MARTAPVPNIPAIPGMNPGVFIMGGGGSGGGGSGGRGNGKGKGQDAKGNKGGQGAAGGGNSANGCGTGAPSSNCTSCSNSMQVGDPVDVATGRVFTVPAIDVALPGPLPLSLRRNYSSTARERDVGFGWGWTHSLGWEIAVRRRTVEVWDGDGTMNEFDLPRVGECSLGVDGRILYRKEWGYALFQGGMWRHFTPVDGDGMRHRLFLVEDANENRLWIEYQDGRLYELVDSVGRVIRVRTLENGRIISLGIKNAAQQGARIDLARYDYDAQGNLVRATDADGFETRYLYDEEHRLTSISPPDGLTFHFVYDEEGRCVETWGALPGGTVPGIAKSAPPVLADRVTPVKGMFHTRIDFHEDGYREVIDSLRVARVFANPLGLMDKSIANGAVTTRTFDEDGNILSHTDALGATTRWERAFGLVVRETNALGQTTFIQRDDRGRPVEFSDALGTILQTTYDDRGNILSFVFALGDAYTFRRNSRGLLVERADPDGSRCLWEYDDHCNITRVTKPDGTTWSFTYDWLGRVTSFRDSMGLETRYAWDNRRNCTAIFWPYGDMTRMAYDGSGTCVYIANSERASRVEHNGMGQPVKIVHPSGETTELRYNWQGLVVEVINEKGESMLLDYDPHAQVRELVGFDGRRLRYKYDLMGRLVGYENGLGEKIEYTYDAIGQLVAIAYPDGVAAEFEYDERGQILSARNDACELSYALSPGGQRVKEVQRLLGQEFVLERSFDAVRARVGLRSSLGHAERIDRDIVGRPVRKILDGAEVVGFTHDASGNELRRALAGGAVIESAWSAGRLVGRHVFAGGRSFAGQPDWVGRVRPGTVISKYFGYTPGGSVSARSDLALGSWEYAYDARERVLARRVGGAPVEEFRYDATNNVYEASAVRLYGPGDRLLSRGSTRYVWDDDGRLVEKIEKADGGDRVWKYTWSPAGTLAAVERPDGRITRFFYDPFQRRIARRIDQRRPGGGIALGPVTRFVFDGDFLAHELREEASASGDPVVHERTYTYDSEGFPLAQRDSRRTGTGWERGAWVFHVNDLIGTPEQLVASDGRVLGQARRTTWGSTTFDAESKVTTPLRFPGQYAEDDVGLHYNRYRFYDPEAGRYISADPAGGLPDTNYFRYCRNPIAYTDAVGLDSAVPHNATATFSNPHSNPPIPAGTPVGDGTTGNRSANIVSAPDRRMYDDRYTPHAGHYRDIRDRSIRNGVSEDAAHQRAGNSARYSERFPDTEAAAMRNCQQDFPGRLAGGTLTIRGERPPCRRCRGRMEEFAQKNGCRVEYHYPISTNSNAPAPHGRGSFVSQGTFTQGPKGARPVENGPVQSRWEHQSATGDRSGKDLERPHTHVTTGYVWGQSDSSWRPSQVRRQKR